MSVQVKQLIRETAQALRQQNIESPLRSVQIILAHALNWSYEELFKQGEAYIEVPKAFFQGIERRSQNEPLAYIIGSKEFFSLDFQVNANVLVPRPETECLVQRVLEDIAQEKNPRSNLFLDIGTGSGVIPIVVKKHFPKLEVWASDISKDCLEVARENAQRHEVDIRFFCSDLFENIPDVAFQIVTANLPYVDIATRDLLAKELSYEPETALFASQQGVYEIFRLIEQASMRAHGIKYLYLEFGEDQYPLIYNELSRYHYRNVELGKDYAGKNRYLIAEK